MSGPRDEEATRRAIRELWLRNRPIALGRLEILRSAVDQLAAGRLEPDTRAEAKSEAHKLRAILGSYGFPDGSEVVAEAEALLDHDVDPGGPGGAADLAARLTDCARSLEADG